MRPLIGILCDFVVGESPHTKLYATYYDAVAAAGGLPVLLPPLSAPSLVRQLIARLDGLVISGGDDLPGELFGEPTHPSVTPVAERRLLSDRCWLQAALTQELPLLGICYGAQLLNVHLGGDLVQDIPTQVPGCLKHRAEPDDAGPVLHDVTFTGQSRLAGVVGTSTLETNSLHHQSVGRPAPGLVVAARSADGVVEAVEAKSGPFLVGVQWHPEKPTGDPRSRRILEELVRAAA